MNESTAIIGKANVALVHGRGDDAKAVLSSVVARVVDTSPNGYLRFVGVGKFIPSVMEHITTVVAPVVKQILDRVSVSVPGFELSLVNLAAAAITQNNIEIEGFSADVPALLAMLSAGLGIPLASDILATGHLASPSGEIALVKDIPAKLDAAMRHSVRMFVYPSLDCDDSLTALTPDQQCRLAGALDMASQHIRTVPIKDVAELAGAVFGVDAIILASLQKGFFAVPAPDTQAVTPIDRVVGLLLSDNDSRFWTVLERHMRAGRIDAARYLLEARAIFEMRRANYPDRFGRRLLDVVRSLPPAIRRMKNSSLLLTNATCIQLSQFAIGTNELDVPLLYDAIRWQQPISSKASSPSVATGEPNYAGTILDTIISEIDAQALARNIGTPIDSARMSYMLDSAVAESPEGFLETITAYYVHLMQYGGRLGTPTSTTAVRDSAVDLIETTFAKRGGYMAALHEALEPTRRGGLRYVLDAITDQYKTETTYKHVNAVLKQAIDACDHRSKEAVIAELLRRLEPVLPAKIRQESRAYFVAHYEVIAKAYVESLNEMTGLLQSL